EDLDERLELEIASWRDRVGIRSLRLLVILPGLLVGLRPRERVADDVLDAHPGERITPRAAAPSSLDVLRVLAERELDPRHRPFEEQFFSLLRPPAQLDHGVLAADRVGAAVEDVRGRETAG